MLEVQLVRWLNVGLDHTDAKLHRFSRGLQ